MELQRQLGLPTGVLVVVASMIGTGIFITTGNVLGMTQSAPQVLILWALGGVLALTGALCYSELAAMMPDVGGEYIYLREIYGMLPAFLTGWISLVVGFSASIALSALSLGRYAQELATALSPSGGGLALVDSVAGRKALACLVIASLGALHLLGVRLGSRVQNALTVVKIAIVTAFILLGLALVDWSEIDRLTATYHEPGQASGLPMLGLALLVITFSYSGWNGAAYVAGEIREPHRNVPRALFWGTLLTTVLYLGLNAVFLMSAPATEIVDQDAIGAVAATSLFGAGISAIFTVAILVVLLSSISVQLMIGPRVYYAMAKDGVIFKSLGRVHPTYGTPAVAILIQIGISMLYVVIGEPLALLQYMGFALGFPPLLAVVGLIRLRVLRPSATRPYRVRAYPLVPLLFIALSTATLAAGFVAGTGKALFATAVVAAGVPAFYTWRRVRG